MRHFLDSLIRFARLDYLIDTLDPLMVLRVQMHLVEPNFVLPQLIQSDVDVCTMSDQCLACVLAWYRATCELLFNQIVVLC
jgi:hypothetical protein